MHWEAITAIATVFYVVLVAITLWYIFVQVVEQKNSRKLQDALTIFKELQTNEARAARREVYKKIPANITGIEEDTLEKYLEIAQEAILPYERIGYLIKEGHIDPSPIIVSHWQPIWRCWRKTENLVRWVREQRGESTYLGYFEHLFQLSETHRIENKLAEPKIH